jgi:pimeloyl-ACP methyl ester carboxylesterase
LLLIQGANDEYGTGAQLEAIRTDASRAAVDTLLLANCGHAPHRDRTALVTSTAAAFIENAAS